VTIPPGAVSPLAFFGLLKWINGQPLLDVIEPYRRRIFEEALFTFEDGAQPRYNLVLAGRAKKNWKTVDLCLAMLYRFLAWPTTQGNDCFILANDEDQAGDDLELVKKLIAANQILSSEVRVLRKEIERLDGKGTLRILPAKDVAGSHGKTFLAIGFDEIHAYRTWDLFEALAPDPTRLDALTWITSYATIYADPNVPLNGLLASAKKADDPRMYFCWYAGDFTTDPAFASDDPERQANPSMGSWGNPGYLSQQKRRLPSHRYRRLHLNLPGAPDGAFLDAGNVLACIAEGRRSLPPREDLTYYGFVDMSGGSLDDAVIAVAHREGGSAVIDLVEKQAGMPPFDPRAAVRKFAELLKRYRVHRVEGDAYAGQTFRADFESEGVSYALSGFTKTQLYEALEPRINAGEVELLDSPTTTEQLLTLVRRGTKIDHQAGDHDDWSNAVAGAVNLVLGRRRGVTPSMLYGDPADDNSGEEHWVEVAPGDVLGRATRTLIGRG